MRYYPPKKAQLGPRLTIYVSSGLLPFSFLRVICSESHRNGSPNFLRFRVYFGPVKASRERYWKVGKGQADSFYKLQEAGEKTNINT